MTVPIGNTDVGSSPSVSNHREIKFKRYHFDFIGQIIGITEWGFIDIGVFASPSSISGEEKQRVKDCQYTGHKINNIELYEGDIIREEVESDEGDERYYSVVTWIKEWSMFACLIVKKNDGINEYKNYLQNSADGLDESMFWTFPIQKEKFGKRAIAGNVYKNRKLLSSVQ